MSSKTIIYLEDAIQVIRDHIYARREWANMAYVAGIREECIEMIRKTPPANPTTAGNEVIRCKDCAHSCFNTSSLTYNCTAMSGMYGHVEEDDYCSRAVKMKAADAEDYEWIPLREMHPPGLGIFKVFDERKGVEGIAIYEPKEEIWTLFPMDGPLPNKVTHWKYLTVQPKEEKYETD